MYLMGCTIYGIWYVKRNMDRKKWCNYAKIEGDLNFSGNQLYVYPIYGELRWCRGLCIYVDIVLPSLAIGAGWLAGFLGIGGGLILGPLLLKLGMLPLVSCGVSGV